MSPGSGKSGHHRRRRRHRRHRRRASVGPPAVVATVLLAGFALLAVAQLAHGRRNLLLVRANLTAARQALTQRDDAGATARLDRAAAELAAARSAASAWSLRVLAPVPLVGSPGRALATATRAGADGVAAGRVLAEASSSFPTSASATVDGHDLGAFHSAAGRSQAAVEEAGRLLSAAASRLGGPAGATIPLVSQPARAMRAEIESGRRQLSGAGRGLALLRDLTAPETDIRLLLLSQDTLELRPTGGFIGSYGVLHFAHGTAKLEKYEATEDLRDPSPPLAAPPGLAPYLVKPWNLSNANWSPDFPSSATSAVELFRRQGGGDVDGVLALTELATARLVGALGGLQLPSYPKPVVEDGFDLRAVFEVELKQPFDVPRKKFLIELANTLYGRLFSLPADKLPAVADAVRRSITAGDIQLWFANPGRQQLLAGSEAEGGLPRVPGDFLMVVDANLTASKANLNVTKLLDYHVDRRGDGRLVGHVRVEVHNDGVVSEINPFYNAYLRVYAPAGSEPADPGAVTVKRLPRDAGFEVFAQPLIVGAKQQAVATFDYVLPADIGAGDAYRLTWLRQVGTTRDRLRAVVDGRSFDADPARRAFVPVRRAG